MTDDQTQKPLVDGLPTETFLDDAANKRRILNVSETCQRGGFRLHMVRRQVEQHTEALTGLSTTPTSDRPVLPVEPSQTRKRTLTGHDGLQNSNQNATIKPLNLAGTETHSGAS